MPKVTVLMPVYNAAPFIQEAIDSILAQTFTDFEFLIIDDGSTDNSRNIVDSFDDMRIIKAPNEKNEGIVASLNKGISLARGTYIAIMHADDVSMPQRLEKQAYFLDENPEVAMVAAKAAFMSASGIDAGFWNEDQITHSSEQIRQMLPKTNCIVHPSVMIRRTVAHMYHYDGRQHATEDYDLWLRLTADHIRIEKLDPTLLKYRVHQTSITGKSNSDLYKEIRTKGIFLAGAVRSGQFTIWFHGKVLWYLVVDFVKIQQERVRQLMLSCARFFMGSLGTLLGAICSRFIKRHGILFMFPFPFSHIGGSERVHAEIVACNLHRSPWILLANESLYQKIRAAEPRSCRTSNISYLLSNPFTKHLLIGFIASYINCIKPVVFGGNCEFFYLLLPHLHPQIFCVDIIHAYDSFMYEISIPHVRQISLRLVLSKKLRDDMIALYQQNDGLKRFTERIELVDYGVNLPGTVPLRTTMNPLEVLYVGRGTIEKRVHLVGQIARNLAQEGIQVNVALVGDVNKAVSEADRQYCTFYGEIEDQNRLKNIYNKADLLVITSSTEGVSLVKMEAMAHGVVPVAVAVGGVPEHIIHGETGFLVAPNQSEDNIVQDFCNIIENVVTNRIRLQRMSNCAYEYARTHFDRSRALRKFCDLMEIS